jgi:hypothetical protein
VVGDVNYIELEVLVPTRLQYSTVRLRAGRVVSPVITGSGGVPPPTPEQLAGARQAAWDDLADELAEQAARQAERVVTRFERDSKKNGTPEPGRRY